MVQNLRPQDERCPISINNLLICITPLYCTETLRSHCQKEGTLNLYHIKNIDDNDADELKIKVWALYLGTIWE